MTEPEQDFHDLMRRLQENEPGAAEELLGRYGDYILRVVRRRLHQRLRSKFDSIDFVQAVWASFFAQLPDQDAFGGPEALVTFLARMAQNKVIDEVRRRLETQIHDVTREQPLDQVDPDQQRLIDRRPTPSQVAVAKEEWDRLLESQPDLHRRILTLRQQGLTGREIARALHISIRSVHRALEKIATELRS